MSGPLPESASEAGEDGTNQRLLDDFCDALWLEDGLARNTLESYRRDLQQFAAWLREKCGKGLPDAGHAELEGYLSHQYNVAKTRASTASRELSSLRRFYRYLLRQGRLDADPTLNISSPKQVRALPKSLTEADVEALLNIPDTPDPLGLRDKAMLETLYATGLRVSELVAMKVAEASLDMGVVRAMGKGGKERLVPLGEEAIAWIRRYLAEARPLLLDGRPSDALFVTARGKAMTRQGF
jgi:integrase/recombinase XerD